MKCKRCHQEATFFYNEQSGGKALSLALCADCAAKAGFYSAHKDLFSPLFGAELSQGLFGAPKGEEKTACPDCGTTWQAMARSGKVGCPQCYNAFREELGRRECEIEPYFNHCCYFNFLHYIVVGNANRVELLI